MQPPAAVVDYRAIAAALRSSDEHVAERSLTELICHLDPKLAGWLKKQGVRDDNDIRDILQITWLKVWQSRADVISAKFCQAWVFRICLNTLMDAGREKQKRYEVCLTDARRDTLQADALDETLDRRTGRSEKRRVLQDEVLAEISRWSETDQKLLWTWINADGDEWTDKLSLETGKKPATLRKRLFDLKQRLRKFAARLDGDKGVTFSHATLAFEQFPLSGATGLAPNEPEGRSDNRG